MVDFTIQYHSKNRAQLVSHDEDLLNEAQLLFSYQKRVFGSFRASADLSGTGVYSCISPSFTFKIGLVLEIYKQLTNAGYKVKIDNELKKHVQPKTHLNESLIQPHANFTYRDYQEETIRRVARFGRGLIEIPTSGGKSLILYGICSNIKEFSKKTLIVVPRTQLVEQFFKEWTVEYGFKGISMYSKNQPNLNADAKVVVTNYQWLVSKEKDKNGKKVSIGSKEAAIRKAGFEAIIVDEAHTIGESGSWMSRFISKFETPYKIGCTGTVAEKEDLSKRWNCIGVIGPIIYKKPIAELQNANQIAKVRIFPIRLEHNTRKLSEQPYENRGGVCFDKETGKQLDGTKMYEAEYKYLESHNGANNILLNVIESLKGNSIVLIDHTEHAQYLYDNCLCENKFLITGKVKLTDRTKTAELVDLKDNNQYIIFANSSAAGTGLSIKNLQNVVIASHGKALTKIIQGIGRVLRKLKKDGEEEVYNVIDIHHNYLFSEKHFNSRCKLYKTRYHKNCKIFKSILVPINTQNEMREKETNKSLDEL